MKRQSTQIVVWKQALLWVFVFVSLGAAEHVSADSHAPLTPAEAIEIKKQLDSDLVTSLTIQPFRREHPSRDLVTQQQITPNAQGEYLLQKLVRIGLNPSPTLFGYEEREDVIQVHGKTIPGALVTLVIRSDALVKEVARADAKGKWSMVFLVDALPEGEHEAYIQSTFQNVKSEEKKIATFIVIGTDGISNTTWGFLILIGVLSVLLLIVINVQLYRRRLLLDKSAVTPPAAEKNDTVTPLQKEEDAATFSSIASSSEHQPNSLEHRD